MCYYSVDQRKFKFDETLKLNILSLELFITMVIFNFSNIFVTSSHLFNSLKHVQCNNSIFHFKCGKAERKYVLHVIRTILFVCCIEIVSRIGVVLRVES